MSAFSFNTTYQPTGDQQKDAIAQIGIMQNRAVQANLAYQSCRDSGALFKVLHQVNNGLRLGNGKYCTLRLFFVLANINCSQRTILPFCQLLIVSPYIVSCQIYVLPAQRRQV
ncbi:Uncharacterised protein [Escherichia coli]|nr:Uncharacterised protein [Escherichia coli]CTX63263.1 Uncharacterised protein [Escherichia coli]CTZ33417.1 Uncharacterised protein [Escherichia coli]